MLSALVLYLLILLSQTSFIVDSTSSIIARRSAFLSRIEEQFQELADEIGEPYRAEAWAYGDKALLQVSA